MRVLIHGKELKQFRVCDALVDQSRYIGEDPIGHRCSNHCTETVVLAGERFDICDKCLEILREDPLRLEFCSPGCIGMNAKSIFGEHLEPSIVPLVPYIPMQVADTDKDKLDK